MRKRPIYYVYIVLVIFGCLLILGSPDAWAIGNISFIQLIIQEILGVALVAGLGTYICKERRRIEEKHSRDKDKD